MTGKQIAVLVLTLIVAFALRVYFIPAPGYEQDIHNFKAWSQTAARQGVHNIYEKPGCDYPPGYLYLLKMTGSFYSKFRPDFKENTYLFTFLIKLPAILADLLISAIIFFFLRKKFSFLASFLAMAAFAFNPAVFFTSAYWGQIDSVSTLIVLLSILALIKNKPFWAWGLIALGLLVKPQMVILLPVIFLVTWKRCGFRSLMGGFAVFWTSFVFILFPFFYFHKVDRVIDLIFSSVGRYPYLSLNAFNLWWLLSFGGGMNAWDGQVFMNLFTYRTFGTILLVIFLALLLRYLFLKEEDEKSLFLACALAFFSFFMLATEMHERYILPAFAFLLLSAVGDRPLKAVYGILSSTVFFNLLIALAWTYPKNLPLIYRVFQGHLADIFISMINLGVLVFFLYLILKATKINYSILFVSAVAVILAVFCAFRPAHPVFLSDLEPREYYQQWGTLRKDKSVDNNPLNVNGFICSKGIGTHANSSIKYVINGRFRYLEGMFGLDDEQNKGNKVEFMIYADNRLIFGSGILQGYQNPHYFHLPIKGVKEINMVVADGGDGINFDHADWLRVKALP